MTKFKFTKKRVLLALTVVGVIAAAGAAYAFFTASGSGTGTGSVGTASSIVIDGGTITGDLFPGGASRDVTITVTNNGSSPQHVGSVSLDSITTDNAHSTCDLSVSGTTPAFTMADVTVDETLAKSGDTGDSDQFTGHLQMNDTGVSQDACQGAPLTLHFTSN